MKASVIGFVIVQRKEQINMQSFIVNKNA